MGAFVDMEPPVGVDEHGLVDMGSANSRDPISPFPHLHTLYGYGTHESGQPNGFNGSASH